MTYRSTVAAAAALILGAALATAASAEIKLVQSAPAANTVVATTKSVSLTFSEKLAPGASLQLSMPEHGMKMGMKTTVSPDGMTLIGTPESALTSGGYKVAWTAAGADGKKMAGQVSFKVN